MKETFLIDWGLSVDLHEGRKENGNGEKGTIRIDSTTRAYKTVGIVGRGGFSKYYSSDCQFPPTAGEEGQEQKRNRRKNMTKNRWLGTSSNTSKGWTSTCRVAFPPDDILPAASIRGIVNARGSFQHNVGKDPKTAKEGKDYCNAVYGLGLVEASTKLSYTLLRPFIVIPTSSSTRRCFNLRISR